MIDTDEPDYRKIFFRMTGPVSMTFTCPRCGYPKNSVSPAFQHAYNMLTCSACKQKYQMIPSNQDANTEKGMEHPNFYTNLRMVPF